MASIHTNKFLFQIKETREKIRDSFKKLHEALQVRENNFISRVDEIEEDFNTKSQEMKSLLEALNKATFQCDHTLSANKLSEVNKALRSVIDNKVAELTEETDSSIEFEWDNVFEAAIEKLGSIKLNGQSIISPTLTFPPQVKSIVPDYKAKQLPIIFGSKSTEYQAPGELDNPRGIAIHYKTGNIYIADRCNNRVQVFDCSGEYIFMFNTKMAAPVGICISKEKVYTTQAGSNRVNKYSIEGKLIKSVGSRRDMEVQFHGLRCIDVSDRNNNVYVCDCYNNRVQILTDELEYHSMLGVGLFDLMLKLPWIEY